MNFKSLNEKNFDEKSRSNVKSKQNFKNEEEDSDCSFTCTFRISISIKKNLNFYQEIIQIVCAVNAK